MDYYTQRHGMRKPINKTYIIDESKYALLFDCCSRYKKYLAWKYPVECPDGNGIVECDDEKLETDLLYEIPTLYRSNNGKVVIPGKNVWDSKQYDQYALLDYVEFIRVNCRDIKNSNWHSFYKHNDLSFATTDRIGAEFEKEINEIFEKTGLLYRFNEEHIIERIEENGVLDKTIVEHIEVISEIGVKELLKDAIVLHQTPNPKAQKDSVEKIWDALERLKTYYGSDKRKSANQLVNDMSGGNISFKDLFDEEFKKLTEIGNNFRIRHHETDKIEITDYKYNDYFFNRCLSLIALAIQYLK
ncbi:TPA: hypothetical protein IAC10_02865 [Candidatus Scatousia excrementigallinarum]|uniref:HEPN AbiJ-N-terminal domain-containing protein n=1 Tax=Candidatus Scatousia excrementigallinarum TaxID=2840935 RepID=A0A9D1EX88_9BACT|nr:hypothetical protein [Candidatus Scatousia excrementigallinarum]